MEKYKAVRQLMAEGEFSKALDHLVRILKKNPHDQEALQLEYTCREMIHIQDACEEDPRQKNSISVEEYITVHSRRFMKKLCHLIARMLSRMPGKWQQKFSPAKWLELEKSFTVETDSQKDWVWELLFWDARRRMFVFISLSLILLCGVAIFLLLAFGGCERTNSELKADFSAVTRSAYAGDAHAQYLLGENFYYGKTVTRDAEQALMWLTKAARTGHKQAADLLQKILVERDIGVQEGKSIWEAKERQQSELTQ